MDGSMKFSGEKWCSSDGIKGGTKQHILAIK